MKLVMVFLLFSATAFNSGCLSQFDERNFLPNALLFERENETVVFCVFEHGKTDLFKRYGGRMQKSTNTTYYLRSYYAETMEKIGEVTWVARDELKHPGVYTLGRTYERVWLFADGLQAFDPFTLKKTVDKNLIEEYNPQLKGKLPSERKYYEWNHVDNTLSITATDGKKWQLDTRYLTASPLVQEPKLGPLAKDRTYRQIQRIWDSFATARFVCNQDTLGNYFYGIYDNEEMLRDGANYRNDASAANETARQCWRAPLRAFSSGHLPVATDRATEISGRDFIDGAFLLDRDKGRPMRCHLPEGWIVCHRSEVGKESTLQFSRLDTAGRELWLVQTGMQSLTGVDQMGEYLLLQGTCRRAGDKEATVLMRILLSDGSSEEVR